MSGININLIYKMNAQMCAQEYNSLQKWTNGVLLLPQIYLALP